MTKSRGRILAIKWGLNPNSSSLGVDVTFLLFGTAALAVLTPVVASLLRLRRPGLTGPPTPPATADGASDETSAAISH
jgi:hypothetical protein